MIRAIFFDFYSVWTPDKFQQYLNDARPLGEEVYRSLADSVEKYYLGEIDLEALTDAFRYKLNRMDIDKASLTLHESDISPNVTNLMRSLHGHFLKLGILADLSMMELGLLTAFNSSQSLFEAILSPSSLGIKAPLLSQQVFGKALDAVGERPSSCLVVSGHDDYLTYASGYGMETIKFVGLGPLGQSLEQLLTKDIPSFVIPKP